MGQDQLDKFLKQQLQNHESSIDPDALWNNINVKSNSETDKLLKDKLQYHETPINSEKLWKKINNTLNPKAISIRSLIILSFSVLSILSLLYFGLKDNLISKLLL